MNIIIASFFIFLLPLPGCHSQWPAYIQGISTQCGPLEGIDCSQLEEWLSDTGNFFTSDITVEKVLEDVPKMTASKKKN